MFDSTASSSLRVFKTEHDSPTTQVSVDYLDVLGKEDKVVLVSSVSRPGVSKFIRAMEWSFFRPGTNHHKEMEVLIVIWKGVPFWVVSVPPMAWFWSEGFLSQCGLKVGDRLPVWSNLGEVERFPIKDSPRSVSLVNSDNHIVHRVDCPLARASVLNQIEQQDDLWCEEMCLKDDPPIQPLLM